MILQYAIKSMKNRFFKFFIIISQLIILTIALNMLFSTVFIKNIAYSEINKFVDSKKILALNMDSAEVLKFNDNKLNERRTFIDEVNKYVGEDNWGQAINSDIEVEKDNKISKYTYIDEYYFGRNAYLIKEYIVDKSYNKYLESHLDSGNVFKNEDFKYIEGFLNNLNDEIKPKYEMPVIAGYNLKENYKIGDKILARMNPKGNSNYNIEYTIVGFLEKDFYGINSGLGLFFNNERNNTDNAIMIPLKSDGMVYEDSVSESSDLGRRIHQAIIFLDGDYKDYENKIQELSDDLDIKVAVTSYEESLDEWLSMLMPQIQFNLLVSGIIFIFVLVGLISSIITLANENKREIGILIASGYSKRQLNKIFLYQYFIVIFSGYLIGLVLALVFKEEIMIYGIANNTVYSLLGPLLIEIVTFIISMILLKAKVNKINPINMIGGFSE